MFCNRLINTTKRNETKLNEREIGEKVRECSKAFYK